MLSLFRNNQFTTVFFLALYVGLTHLSALLGFVEMPDGIGANGGVLYQAWFGWAETHAFYSAVGAAILVFIQAFMVNALADEFRLLTDRNWLPGLFYALSASCLPDFLYLSPPLVASTFIAIVLWRIFKTFKQPAASGLIFDVGLWATFSSLFYPPAIFLLISGFAGITIIRAFNLREQMVMLSGVFIPLFLAWLWYFWMDRGSDFGPVQFGNLFQLYRPEMTFDLSTILKTVLMVVLLLTVLLSYGVYSFRKLNQIQKYVGVLYWFLFVAGLSTFTRQDPQASHLVLLMPPIGIFLAMSFSSLRSKIIAEFFHLALLGFVLTIQFLNLLTKINAG